MGATKKANRWPRRLGTAVATRGRDLTAAIVHRGRAAIHGWEALPKVARTALVVAVLGLVASIVVGATIDLGNFGGNLASEAAGIASGVILAIVALGYVERAQEHTAERQRWADVRAHGRTELMHVLEALLHRVYG